MGGRPRVRLRGESGLPDPRRRALHPRREAAPTRPRRARWPAPAATRPSPTTCGSRRSTSPRAGTATAPTWRRRGPHPTVRDLPQPRTGRARPAGPHQPRRAPGDADRSARRRPTARRRDELVGSLRAKPGLRRYLRRTPPGCSAVDHGAAKREAHLDGKWLLRTSDTTLTPDDLAAAYKQLLAVERGWRDFKGALGLGPGVPLPRGPHPRPHPAVLARAPAPTRDRERHGDTWRNTRHELDRMHLITLATDHGQVAATQHDHSRPTGRASVRSTCPNRPSSSTSPSPRATEPRPPTPNSP